MNLSHICRAAMMAASMGIISYPATARTLSPDEALGRALGSDRQQVGLMSRGSGQSNSLMKLTHTGPLVGPGKAPAYYVYEEQGRSASGNGFLIASADDRLRPVLAIADEGTFAQALEQENTRWWLSQYEEEMAAYLDSPQAKANDGLASRSGSVFANYDRWTPIEPIVKTRWNQGAPYNAKCPTIGGVSTVTGCVPVAVAQVVNAIRHYDGKGERTLGGKYDSPAYFNFEGWKPDFDKMDPSSKSYDTEEVATLMLACGIASGVGYGTGATGGESVMPGFVQYMGYSPHSRSVTRSGYSADVWESMVYETLRAGRPMAYNGSGSGSHAFVCDGYSENGLFHFNWGWGGMSDGYYALSALNPKTQGIGGSNGGYANGQTITFFVVPGENAPKIPYNPLLAPCSVIYQSELGNPSISGNNYTFRNPHTETGASVYTLAPLPYKPGLELQNIDDGTVIFIGENDYRRPSEYRDNSMGNFTVTIPSGTLPDKSQWTVYPAYSVEGYEGHWRMGVQGNVQKDHWVLTVNDPYLNFTPTDKVVEDPGFIAADYSVKTLCSEYKSNRVGCLVTNVNDYDLTIKLGFVLISDDGTMTPLADATTMICAKETKEFSLSFATSGINPGKYRLCLYSHTHGLLIDEKGIEVNVTKESGNGNGNALYASDASVGLWIDGGFSPLQSAVIPQGKSFAGVTSFRKGSYAGTTLTYYLAFFEHGQVRLDKMVGDKFLIGESRPIGNTPAEEDRFEITPSLPVGNYTMAFLDRNNNLLGETADFSVGFSDGTVFYKVNDDNKSVTAHSLSDSGITKVEFPAEVNGYALTAIGSNVFNGNRNIEYVTVPASVSRIEANAFRATTGLKSVTFHPSVPPYAHSATLFYGTNPDVKIYVAPEHYDAYAANFNSSGTLCRIADLTYDLNGDNLVTVADVTFLVARILEASKDPRYDLDGKNGVDVGDVTLLVGIILQAEK
ncbi:MAG: C10 family peptidase [Pseudoflavonifractor sp.]|nr:C10 family peptidase [Alloprevotella sp.]MCM1116635.1 C10 family peptidase [Pseudoflavonifractor sp.]